METLDTVEKIISIICQPVTLVISIIALLKINYALKQVYKVKNEKKQEATKNKNSSVFQNMK